MQAEHNYMLHILPFSAHLYTLVSTKWICPILGDIFSVLGHASSFNVSKLVPYRSFSFLSDRTFGGRHRVVQLYIIGTASKHVVFVCS